MEEPRETQPAEILPGRLYVGSAAQAHNWELLTVFLYVCVYVACMYVCMYSMLAVLLEITHGDTKAHTHQRSESEG